jgi:hypothetical protein
MIRRLQVILYLLLRLGWVGSLSDLYIQKAQTGIPVLVAKKFGWNMERLEKRLE